jgi:hypothetical protein
MGKKKNAGNIYGTIKIRKNWVRIRGMSMVLKLIPVWKLKNLNLR